MATNRRLARTTLELPKSLLEQIKALTEDSGPPLTTLCVIWVIQAAQLARAGYGHLLPPEGYGYDAEDRKPVRPAWSGAERERCREAIEGAGSSMPAVARRAGESFVEAGGNLLEMSWPPLEGIFRAA